MKKKNINNVQSKFYKKKKMYQEFFDKNDLFLLKKAIYTDNYNNISALHIKKVLKPLKHRALGYKELRRLWIFLDNNGHFYKEFKVFSDYMNDIKFTSREMSKIEDFFLEYTFEDIKYIEVKKRLYNGNLKMADFRKIKKILYNKIDSYTDYMVIKKLLEKCLSNIKNYDIWLTNLNAEKDKIKSKLTRDDLERMTSSYKILSQTEIDKVQNLVLDLEAGYELYQKDEMDRYLKYNYLNFQFNLYKGSSLTEHPFKNTELDYDYDLTDWENKNISDSDSESDVDDITLINKINSEYNYNILSLIPLDYYNYFNDIYLYYCDNLFLDFFNYININDIDEREMELDNECNENNYIYFPFRKIAKYDYFKVVFGENEDDVFLYNFFLELKYLVGSHESFEYTALVNLNAEFSIPVRMNSFSWHIVWRDEFVMFKDTYEYGFDMFRSLGKQDHILKEKSSFLINHSSNKQNFILSDNIDISIYKPTSIKSFNFLNILMLFYSILNKNKYKYKYILNFNFFKKKIKLNVFFKLNINLKFIRCRHIFLIKTVKYYDYYKITAYVKQLDVDFSDFNEFSEMLLNIIDHKERSKK